MIAKMVSLLENCVKTRPIGWWTPKSRLSLLSTTLRHSKLKIWERCQGTFRVVKLNLQRVMEVAVFYSKQQIGSYAARLEGLLSTTVQLVSLQNAWRQASQLPNLTSPCSPKEH